MSIEVQNLPYEVLFRFNEDGSFKGAHRKDLEIVVNTATGQVYSTKELDPIAVSLEGLDPVISSLNLSVHDALQAALQEIQRLEGELSLLTQTDNSEYGEGHTPEIHE